jgi:hypothetical protein
MVACSSVLTRWSDHLGQESRNNLLTAPAKVRSIADAVSQSPSPSQGQWKDIAKTNLDVTDLVRAALGEARRAEERSNG